MNVFTAGDSRIGPIMDPKFLRYENTLKPTPESETLITVS